MPVVAHGDVRIAYESHGSGPPVILNHSFLCSGAMWAPQVPALAARHRVINIDLRGHGASGPVHRPCNIYDLVDDTLAVMDHAGVDRAVWGGLSIGGMIALRAALTVPDRVAALILVDTDGGAETMWRRIKLMGLGGAVQAFGMRPALPEIGRSMFGATTRRTQRTLVKEWKRRFASVDVPSIVQIAGALRQRDDVVSRLSSVKVPALVLVGAEDVALPPPRSRRIATALPQATLHEIPGVGHLVSLEHPEAVTTAMVDFLNQVEGASR
jgi:pimeloyl-ACP methyl ester carboxylesterase